MGQGSPRELVKAPWESKIRKGPRKPKESKWAKDAQEGNGTQEPANNVRKGLVNALSHWEGNKQQAQQDLVKQYYSRNSRVVRQENTNKATE